MLISDKSSLLVLAVVKHDIKYLYNHVQTKKENAEHFNAFLYGNCPTTSFFGYMNCLFVVTVLVLEF